MPVFADVNPRGKSGVAFQFGYGEFDCAVAAATGGKYGVETLQRFVEINHDPFVYGERTHATDGVPYQRSGFVVGKHFGFCAETGSVFGIVHSRGARVDNQDGLTCGGVRQRFCEVDGFAKQCSGGKFLR